MTVGWRASLQWVSSVVLLGALVACGVKRPITGPELGAGLYEVFFTRADGTAISGAVHGWFVETPQGIDPHGLACCTDQRGSFSFRASEVPGGDRVWLYMLEPPPGDGYALVRWEVHTPSNLELQPAGQLLWLHGRLRDQQGQPLAAVVNVTLKPGNGTPLDRALLSVQPASTDAAGKFGIRVASRGPFDLKVVTWDHADDSSQHLYTREVVTKADVIAGPAEEQALTVPGERIVACTLHDQANQELVIRELAISLLPHGNSGHSGGCAYPGGEDDFLNPPDRSFEKTVRFLWPEGAKRVTVTAQGEGPDGSPLIGVALLEAPSDSCRLEARPDASQER